MWLILICYQLFAYEIPALIIWRSAVLNLAWCGQTTEIIELRKWIVLFSVKLDGWFRDLVHCTKSNCFVVLAAVKVFNLTVAYSADKSYWTMKRMREVVNSWSDSVNSRFGLLPSELSIAISVLVLINRLKLRSKVRIS